MNDLISRAELFNALATAQDKADCFSIIQGMETIDAEPVRHEHWIEAHDNDGMDYECSNRKCQCRISYNGAKVSGDFNYCPNCGANMDEVSE